MLNKFLFIDSPTSNKRSYWIDALRGFFAIWVMFSHVIPWSVINLSTDSSSIPYRIIVFLTRGFQTVGETHPAVLCFIVLSGYCIHRNGLRDIGKQSVTKYAIRRLFRIYPVYIFAILIGVFSFIISTHNNAQLVQGLTATKAIGILGLIVKSTGLSSFWPFAHSFSFQGNAPLSTVAVEMYLYALYPIVLYFVYKHKKESIIFYGCIFSFLIGVILMCFLNSLYGWWNNGSIVGFFPYWWIGVFSLNKRFSEAIWRKKNLLVVFWVLLSISIYLLSLRFTVIAEILAELRKVIFALIFGSSIWYFDTNVNVKNNILSWIGKSGYSIYAIHAPIAVLMLSLNFSYIVIIPIVILIGLLMFFVIEKPANNIGRTIAEKASVIK